MTEDEREKLFFEGVEQFNKREFFDCHETLEHLWTHDRSDERELIQGIIQIAVGYYHFLRENHVGALKLLRRGLERVKKYEPRCMSLNIQKFAKDVSVNIEEIDRMETGTHGSINIPQIESERD
ncbi:MAG TPA: DUF309 domain-containing protein [Drouetiella sp.]